MANTFGGWVKARRLAGGLTLRGFCEKHGLDPGNISRLERGVVSPPQDEGKLAEYATALGMKPGTPEWQEFFDRAAAAQGKLPKDLLEDEELVEKLPLLFRTLRGEPLPPDKLDDLVDKVRRS
jgi:transcriptional regulator with XRE-family HTH domain